VEALLLILPLAV